MNSKYKFVIRDYHAIKEADIQLNGITVLAGINGCGKSTLSRWLYYMIHGVNSYERILIESYMQKLSDKIERYTIINSEILRMSMRVKHIDVEKLFDEFMAVKFKFSELGTKVGDAGFFLDEAEELFRQALNTTEHLLLMGLDNSLSEVRISRILRYLDILETKEDVHEMIHNYVQKEIQWIEKLTDNLLQNIKKRPVKDFFLEIAKKYSLGNDIPNFIQLYEDEVSIADEGHISSLFNLQHAIYIDTPMSIDFGSTEHYFWNELRHLLLMDKQEPLSTSSIKLLKRIKWLLHGEVIVDEEDFFNDRSLRYVSEEAHINIRLQDTATGFKTFSYLQRLLENGLLNPQSLLLIDEPEAHLHPQWIVEFAHLLILLNKQLGLKIMLASHNPDMVAAIHDIAEKEGVLSETTFYVAKPDAKNPYRYTYSNLGQEVGEIFESFNMAYRKIEQYATGNSNI